MLGSCFLEFKLDYSETKNLAIGDFVSSEEFSLGFTHLKVVPKTGDGLSS